MRAFLYAAIKNGETAKRILSSGKKLSEKEKDYLFEVMRQAERARKILEEDLGEMT